MHIGIPACREHLWLPSTLAGLSRQRDLNFCLWIFVNQPRGSLQDPAHRSTLEDNQATLKWLDSNQSHFPFPVKILNGLAPEDHVQGGAGQARRTLFDQIAAQAQPEDICVSLDADTATDPDYTQALKESFRGHPSALGCIVPYYHHLPADPEQAVRILRYELYMRHFQLSLAWADSPFAFTALGSAMAFRVKGYLKAGGFPRRPAGEDFYFLQQLVKCGEVIRQLPVKVYPSPRISDRVPFGTGPVMGLSLSDQAQRFPFFSQSAFAAIKETLSRFPELYDREVALPIDEFLETRLKGRETFKKIRRNYRSRSLFVRACHGFFDGLRSLQFLRWFHRDRPTNPQHELQSLGERLSLKIPAVRFGPDQVPVLNNIRDQLAEAQRGSPGDRDESTM